MDLLEFMIGLDMTGCHDLLMMSVNVKDIDDVDKKSK